MRLSALPADSAFGYALFPVDPDTGKRSRREPVTVIDDPDQVDAYFARQAG
ncbi:hypothetical protein [Blastococcus sp. CT_GayMR16]|uniref:hypothetical protein n=1 Tax=Blastococcus sp. CT_GayMR16 TaxID=2559607 RepID=UPI0014315D03|nr:hypothetical protein [Blastococcus sp. CT_GayMR16]